MEGPDQIFDASAYVTSDINGKVKLRLDENTNEYPPMSLPSMLTKAAEESPDQIALGVKRDGDWVKWTYSDYLKDVRCASRAFIKLGLEPRRAVAIMGFNSPEWFISDLAAVFSGGVAVGIYPTNSPDTTKYIAAHCRSNIIVVEDDVQLQKILKIRSDLPDLKAIVQYTGIPLHEDVISWQAFMKIGEESAELDQELDSRLKSVGINECAHLVYTSGTTGKPKAVMLSHDNLTFTARIIRETYKLKMNYEKNVSYLPLSHVAANLVDLIIMMSCHGTTYFAEKTALKGTITHTLKEVQPTMFFGVPRVYEKIQEKMQEVGRANKGLKRQIGNWAKKTGLKRNRTRIEQNRRQASGGLNDSLSFKIANKLVFEKVKTALGLNKCGDKFFVAAAPFNNNTFEYFLSLDIRILEIYGMSECSGPHTVNTPSEQGVGSVGQSMKGCKTKIDADINSPTDTTTGEILMSGRHVMMGYMGSEERTAETVIDSEEGWLRTGDVGMIDSDGFLFITGRIKEILITAGGENVPPVPIEDDIKQELPCVSNAIVVGDRQRFLSCLLTLKTEVDQETASPTNKLSPATLSWLLEVADVKDAKTIDELLDGPEYPKFAKAIQLGIDGVNQGATSNAQKVQKWQILKKDFSVPGGELGPTLKVKRHVVSKIYTDTIEKIYR